MTGWHLRNCPNDKSDVPQGEIVNMDTKTVYDNYMHNFRWGGINNPKVYLDENNNRMLLNIRSGFAKLAEALVTEGKEFSNCCFE